MPIRITKVGRQRTVSGLAKALFETKGSAALQERAEAALLKANPQLATEGGLKAGATVIVPSVRDVAPKAEAPAAAATPSPPTPGSAAPAGAGAQSREPAIAAARERATALAELGGRSIEAALGAAKRSVRELRSEEVAAAVIAARPDMRDRLEAVRGEADKEVKRITEAGKQLRKVTALALADLAALGEPMKPDG
ncbi:MAG TPA: hypothetical protein VEW26_02470 [Allosphingosinicella sp.]|nr:hypothetical protein [Allosphingosinicella sp.]